MQGLPVSLADALSVPTWEAGPHDPEEPADLSVGLAHQPRKIELPSEVACEGAGPLEAEQQPLKIELPAEAACLTRQASADEDPMALGRMVRSPPPTQPPSLSVLLSSPPPQTPPPPPPSALMPAALSASLPPLLPPSLLGDAVHQGSGHEAAIAELCAWADPLLEGVRAAAEAPFPPGPQAPGGSPSSGSMLHGTGQCRPCAWFWKPGGCQNAWSCQHCHLCPEGEIKARKKAKQTMARLGLATPQPGPLSATPLRKLSFGLEPEAATCSPTTCSEQETSGSDQESAAGRASEPETDARDAARDAALEQGLALAAGLEVPPGLGVDFEYHAAISGVQQLQAAAAVASAGSALHGTGVCRPCAWFWKPVGCQNAQSCSFCHLCPESELKDRKKYKQAMLRKDLSAPKPGQAPSALAPEQQAKCTLSLSSLL